MNKLTKLFMLLSLSAVTTAIFAQETKNGANPLSLLIERKLPLLKTNATAYPLTAEAPQEDEEQQPALKFPYRVWFPGEWEEVKAIVVTARYEYLVAGHEDDDRYRAQQIFKNYGTLYFQEDKDSREEYLGRGVCKSKLDVTSPNGMVFLHIMDGIQKGGAEAWVRIEEPGDEQLIRAALQNNGLRNDKMKFFVAPGNAYWFRDCGPICFYYGDNDNLAMLNFQYMSSRPSDDMLSSYIHEKFDIPNYINDVIWEGGNCIVDGLGGLITSTATYDYNNDSIGRLVWDGKDTLSIRSLSRTPLDPASVREALSGMLGQRQLTVLPRLNYDGKTGHIDLYIDATDENSFLISKMPEIYDTWSDYDLAFGNAATLYNKKTFFGRKYYDGGRLPFPSYGEGEPWNSEIEYDKFARSYANHTFVNNYILQPCFSPVGEDGMPTAAWDRANIEALKAHYPGYTIHCIDMRSFDGQGGSIHCVTKQIPADNPVRIIHKNIHGYVNPGTLTDIPFSAVITNKSGIKEAKLVYSINGGTWNEMPLTANGNRWSCTFPVSTLNNGQAVGTEGAYVHYYIQATSNNGKTTTKPVNANYGQTYTFALTSSVEYDDNMFDFETTPMPAEMITFDLDTRWLTEDKDTQPTAITEVKSDVTTVTDNAWYTINGVRLTARPTAKGIYIYNGKKIVIK